MWPDFQSDARPLDTGLASRRNTEGGTQPADKSLIDRRLKRSISCSMQNPPSNEKFRSHVEIAVSGVCCSVSTLSLDYGHKSYGLFTPGGRIAPLRHPS
jgi:hypothetical protein